MSTEPRSPDEPRGRETTRRPEAPPNAAQPIEREVPVPAPSVSPAEALEIATDAYVYAYPMVLLQLTARTMTNVVNAETGRAPLNQFAHMRTFPDPTFTDVVRPNADTLYSLLFFDVASDPLVINVPDAAERYYLLPMIDWWTMSLPHRESARPGLGCNGSRSLDRGGTVRCPRASAKFGRRPPADR